MSINTPPVSNKGSRNTVSKYVVQRITPRLLLRLDSENKPNIAKANPNLRRAIADYDYRVEPQDVLSIVVWGSTAQTSIFSATGTPASASQGSNGHNSPGAGFRVDSKGNVYFPYVGEIHVAGLTVSEVQSQLTKKMVPYLKNPQLSVEVSQFNSQTFQLSGSVVKPGIYPVTNVPETVSQAISAAGGVIRQVPNTITSGNTIPRALADLAHVLYIHDGKRHILNMRAFFQDGDESQDRLIRPGDIIQVPDNSFDQVHLIGEIRNPGNYPLDSGKLNLAEALGAAGGLNLTTANASRIFVFRGAYSKPQVFWLNAHSPQAMLLAADFELKPQDVVYVATAGVSTWNRIISQILPTVQTLYETKVLVNK